MNETFAVLHLNKSDVELYVINALASSRAAEVESHVACCEACAEALAREAQLEMALEILAERTSFDVEIVHAQVPPVLDALPMSFDTTRVTPLPLHSSSSTGASARVVPFVPAAQSLGSVTHKRARTGIAFAGALAAAAALVLWIMPSAKSDPSDDVATYGAVSADAAGAMVSFDHDVKPNLDKLDGG